MPLKLTTNTYNSTSYMVTSVNEPDDQDYNSGMAQKVD